MAAPTYQSRLDQASTSQLRAAREDAVAKDQPLDAAYETWAFTSKHGNNPEQFDGVSALVGGPPKPERTLSKDARRAFYKGISDKAREAVRANAKLSPLLHAVHAMPRDNSDLLQLRFEYLPEHKAAKNFGAAALAEWRQAVTVLVAGSDALREVYDLPEPAATFLADTVRDLPSIAPYHAKDLPSEALVKLSVTVVSEDLDAQMAKLEDSYAWELGLAAAIRQTAAVGFAAAQKEPNGRWRSAVSIDVARVVRRKTYPDQTATAAKRHKLEVLVASTPAFERMLFHMQGIDLSLGASTLVCTFSRAVVSAKAADMPRQDGALSMLVKAHLPKKYLQSDLGNYQLPATYLPGTPFGTHTIETLMHGVCDAFNATFAATLRLEDVVGATPVQKLQPPVTPPGGPVPFEYLVQIRKDPGHAIYASLLGRPTLELKAMDAGATLSLFPWDAPKEGPRADWHHAFGSPWPENRGLQPHPRRLDLCAAMPVNTAFPEHAGLTAAQRDAEVKAAARPRGRTLAELAFAEADDDDSGANAATLALAADVAAAAAHKAAFKACQATHNSARAKLAEATEERNKCVADERAGQLKDAHQTKYQLELTACGKALADVKEHLDAASAAVLKVHRALAPEDRVAYEQELNVSAGKVTAVCDATLARLAKALDDMQKSLHSYDAMQE